MDKKVYVFSLGILLLLLLKPGFADSIPPLINITNYVNDTWYNSTDDFIINISTYDVDEVDDYAFITIGSLANQTLTNDTFWYNGTLSLSGLSEARHGILVYVNDSLNNLGLNDSYTLQIDDTVPTTTISVFPTTPDGSNGWYVNNVFFNLSCSDNSGVGCENTYYNLNAGTWLEWTSQVTVYSQENNTIAYYSNDTLNNTEIVNNYYIAIDKTDPTLNLPIYVNDSWYKNSDNFVISVYVNDSESGSEDWCYIGVDINPNETVSVTDNWCNKSYSLSGISEGRKQIYIKILDKAGHITLNDSYTLHIDDTLPVVELPTYTNDSWYKNSSDFLIDIFVSDGSLGEVSNSTLVALGSYTNQTMVNSEFFDLIEYYDIGYTTYGGAYSDQYLGQAFTPSSSHYIDMISLLCMVQTPGADAVVTINITGADAFHLPNDTIFGSVSVSTDYLEDRLDWYPFKFSPKVWVNESVEYVVVASNSISNSAYLLRWYLDLTGTYSDGGMLYHEFGGEWNNTYYYTRDLMFRNWNYSGSKEYGWYNGTLRLTSLSEGRHSIKVYNEDSAGNLALNDSYTLRIDETAPSIELPLIVNDTEYYINSDFDIHIKVDDGGVGLDNYCFLWVSDGGNNSIAVSDGWCNDTISLSGLTEGRKKINVYINDTLGNTALNDSYTLQISTEIPPPIINLPEIINDTWYKISDTILVNATVTTYGELDNYAFVWVGEGTNQSVLTTNDAWNLEEYTYYNVNISTQGGIPTGFFFKPDGLKLYEIEDGENEIYQSTCSDAWNLSSCNYNNVNISTQDLLSQDLFFKPDGLKMYEIGSSSIYQYTCSDAWNLSSCSYNNVNISTQDIFSTDLFFSPTGLKMYEMGDGYNKIYQYACPNAWDLLSCKYIGISISTQSSYPDGLFFKTDGTKLYETGTTKIYQYTCSDAWNLSSCSYNNVNISTQDIGPMDLFFKPDGLKLYVLGHVDDKIYQYSYSGVYWANTTYSLSGLSEGRKKINIFANDTLGHSGLNNSFTIRIDDSAPTTTILTAPSTPNGENNWYVSNVFYNLSCSDNSGVGCGNTYHNINAGSWMEWTSQTTLYSEENNTIVYYSNDTFNNTEITKFYYIAIDKTDPTASLPEITNDTWYANSQSLIINISVSDYNSGLEDYCWVWVEGQALNTSIAVSDGWCNNSITLAGLSDSRKAIYVFINDTAGNTVLNDSYTLKMDSSAPNIDIDSANATWYKTTDTASLDITITDIGVGFTGEYCFLDIGDNGNISEVINTDGFCNFTGYSLTGLSEGLQQIKVYANDTLGNLGLNNTYYIGIDDTSPTIIINSPINATWFNTTAVLDLDATITDNTYGQCYLSIGNQLNATDDIDANGFCNFTDYLLSGLDSGLQKIELFANDSLGNIALNNTWYIQIGLLHFSGIANTTVYYDTDLYFNISETDQANVSIIYYANITFFNNSVNQTSLYITDLELNKDSETLIPVLEGNLTKLDVWKMGYIIFDNSTYISSDFNSSSITISNYIPIATITNSPSTTYVNNPVVCYLNIIDNDTWDFNSLPIVQITDPNIVKINRTMDSYANYTGNVYSFNYSYTGAVVGVYYTDVFWNDTDGTNFNSIISTNTFSLTTTPAPGGGGEIYFPEAEIGIASIYKFHPLIIDAPVIYYEQLWNANKSYNLEFTIKPENGYAIIECTLTGDLIEFLQSDATITANVSEGAIHYLPYSIEIPPYYSTSITETLDSYLNCKLNEETVSVPITWRMWNFGFAIKTGVFKGLPIVTGLFLSEGADEKPNGIKLLVPILVIGIVAYFIIRKGGGFEY